jgi:predicted dienelactone hydrolase
MTLLSTRAKVLLSGAAIAASGWTLAFAQDPTIVLPAPTGTHAVGTFSATWFDPARTESITATPRPVGIQVWYPAQHESASARAPYGPGVDSSGSDYGRLLARVATHASWRPRFEPGLPPAPLIVFSTGRSMTAYDYTSLAEDLASHGYVVVGVNSPGLSRMANANGEPIPPRPAPSLEVLRHFDSADVYFEPMVRDVGADLRLVLAKLEFANHSDSILAGHLDLRRLAMLGHSNGALAASRACAQEGRCRAFVGIEGTQTREIRKQGIRKPYLLLISDTSLGYDAEGVYRETGTRPRSRYTAVIVKGAGHNTFTDLLLVRPTLFHYAIAPGRGVDITRAAVRAYLDQNLLGRKDAALGSVLAPYPEVEVQTKFAPPARD